MATLETWEQNRRDLAVLQDELPYKGLHVSAREEYLKAVWRLFMRPTEMKTFAIGVISQAKFHFPRSDCTLATVSASTAMKRNDRRTRAIHSNQAPS